ncbi:RHS repeat-associated protein [Chryseobacterium rhizosphaerae]|uniref:DUF6443 domain-containing protein n=1 Tax=Chryseobacterium rhizosphaerae TaxID=395937 RepID=UPI0028595E14|nr:DUF6443 domain-containing protein [Chryseobacterium rhizosphaerae]MDR6546535.1 RHS repeat-associated protein [Chryseobacterium rhizosphaerae]
MKKIIIPIGVLMIGTVQAQVSNTENYIQSKTYLDYNGTTPTKTSETVQYFDGLGRPKQVVNVKASPLGRDVVTHIEYDGFGRQVKDYLPVPQGGTLNGAIVPNPLANATQPGIYGQEKIYAEKILENSPLDRIQQQIQVGNDWSNKPVKFEYDANIWEDYVRKYETSTTWVEGRTQTSIQLLQYFQASQLYKNIVTDEDGNKTIEFKNGKGQLILSRKPLNTENADTYYVYNEYDQLAFVIPPLASSPTIEPATVENLYYQYRYDGKNRLVEKKLPGKGWEHMIYDKADRLVMTQDANLKSKSQWLITEYDALNRVAYTGLIYNSASRNDLQGYISSNPINNIKRSTSYFTVNGMDAYYNMSPTVIVNVLLSVNYYDTYPPYSFNPVFPSTIQGESVLPDTPSADGRSTKGLPVMSVVKNIEDDNWTKNYTYYDTKGRSIGSHSINHLGGYTKTESKLDFAGVPQTVVTKHKRLTTDTERIITENFEYDAQNRLLVHKHQVDSNPVEILAQNTYNELSQLSNKKVGGTSLGSSLQSIDYAYNIRGWMTKINDPSNLNGKLFGYGIRYNNPINTPYAPARYNGNIAEVDWKTPNDNTLKRYSYSYYAQNRLMFGHYSEPLTAVPENSFYDEYLEYDLNGNITVLSRNSKNPNSGFAMGIDALSYTYTGNRLLTVKDATQNYLGYAGGGNTIAYDSNGNMTDHQDKGILQIDYNFLNLPNYIKFDRTYIPRFIGTIGDFNVNTKYTYRADGTKLKKMYTFGSGKTNKEANVITEYLDGFQYEMQIQGGAGFFDMPLKFVPTAEGYFNFENNKYIYNYVDHLGNIRLSYFNNGNGAQIFDENNYYPFGLKHGTGESANPSYKYQYNGKELQETGAYDYGARMYMPDLGRWGVVDPLAETSRRWSPYTYAFNNPINFIDPDGRQGTDWVGTTDANGSTQWHWEDKIKNASQAAAAGYDSYSDGKTNNTYTSNSGSEVTLKTEGNWSEDFTNVNRERLGTAINNCPACKQLESVEKTLFIGVPIALATGGMGGLALSGETTAISLALKASGSAGMQYVGTGDVNIMSVIGDTFGAYGTGEVLGGLTELSYEKLRSGEPAFRTVFNGSMSWSEGVSNVGVALVGKGLTNLNGLTKAGATGLDKGIVNANNYLIGTAAYKAAQIRAEEIKKK